MVRLGKPQQYDAVAAAHYARAEWRIEHYARAEWRIER
jgi:hypothetical protein